MPNGLPRCHDEISEGSLGSCAPEAVSRDHYFDRSLRLISGRLFQDLLKYLSHSLVGQAEAIHFEIGLDISWIFKISASE